ncbi:carbon-nitrogen hydrolase family protein [Paenibacillus sp. IITD108]|uniref:carbon-nitrogen hydrolase family protein n=1 Tax=Paenibacillus sp. IITD108 TaxID=3116649 RepID=UPI002F42BBD5
MSRYVTISTIGPYSAIVAPELSMEEAVPIVIEHLSSKIQQVLPDQPDLIVLPELCDKPDRFTSEQKKAFYKARGNRVLNALSELARSNECYIVYPHCRELDDGTYRNSAALIDRNGRTVGYYDKNYPVVPSETESDGIVAGTDAVVLQCDFGTVGFAICFDLNYDALRRKYEMLRPDLIVFSSMYHGGLMQAYWAYSCRAHFVGAIAFEPLSTILSPLGEQLAASTNYYDYVTQAVNLDCAVIHLDNHYDKLHQMREKYGRKVKVVDPGNLGAVLISSESNEFTVQDLAKEFDFIRIDDYLRLSEANHLETLSNKLK